MGSPTNTKSEKEFLRSKKVSLVSTSSSYSFLEIPWSCNEAKMAENVRYIDRRRQCITSQEEPIGEDANKQTYNRSTAKHTSSEVSGTTLFTDPLFYRYDFIIPPKLKRFVKNAPFRFSLGTSCFLEILESGNPKVMLEVLDFKDLGDNFRAKTETVIVVNRKLFRQKLVAEENQSYKNAISQKMGYERRKDRFKEISTRAIEYQVRSRINFLNVDGRDDFLREMKCIVKSFSAQDGYIPKVKTFLDDQKGFASYVISMIPGISKNVASALVERFENLCLINDFVKSCDKQELESIEVWNDDRSQQRSLGAKQARLIKSFLSGSQAS